MLGILWKGKYIWSETIIPERPEVLIVDKEKCRKGKLDEVVWGWSEEGKWSWYIRCGKKWYDLVTMEEVEGVEIVDIDKFKNILSLAMKIQNEYVSKFVDIKNDMFKVYVFNDVPYVESKVKMHGSVPLDVSPDEYLKKYSEILREIYDIHRRTVKELEQKYRVKVVFG